MQPGRRWLQRYGFYGAVIASELILFSPAGEGALPFTHFDKVVHLVLFGLLTASAGWRFGLGKGVVAGLLSYVPASELVQEAWVAGRRFDVVDILVDVVAVGIVVAWMHLNRGRVHGGAQ